MRQGKTIPAKFNRELDCAPVGCISRYNGARLCPANSGFSRFLRQSTNGIGGTGRSGRVGLCIDHSGDDKYLAPDSSYVQGFGFLGVGMLVDDLVVCGAEPHGSFEFPMKTAHVTVDEWHGIACAQLGQ